MLCSRKTDYNGRHGVAKWDWNSAARLLQRVPWKHHVHMRRLQSPEPEASDRQQSYMNMFIYDCYHSLANIWYAVQPWTLILWRSDASGSGLRVYACFTWIFLQVYMLELYWHFNTETGHLWKYWYGNWQWVPAKHHMLDCWVDHWFYNFTWKETREHSISGSFRTSYMLSDGNEWWYWCG
jgi:hypothetical protein